LQVDYYLSLTLFLVKVNKKTLGLSNDGQVGLEELPEGIAPSPAGSGQFGDRFSTQPSKSYKIKNTR
jgi:hypothetical protein